jgi:hypothetical protein
MAIQHSKYEVVLPDFRRDAPTWVCDQEVVPAFADECDRVVRALESPGADWQSFSAFWPPRAVLACKSNMLIPFFGAGVSANSGLPDWKGLLRDTLHIQSTFVDDESLANDPLTLAEIAAQLMGTARLQDDLKREFSAKQVPTTAHLMLAWLRCPIYITTNYDLLFEKAWDRIHGGRVGLKIITTDADWEDGDTWSRFESCADQALLIKIHGSCDKAGHQLILTRRDYRIHYRTNVKLFTTIKEIFSRRHVLFLGFSHRDPEVSRLVEDAIFNYERVQIAVPTLAGGGIERPHFYSLQFDMRKHEPEIYAAKGMVALRPPLLNPTSRYSRSIGLASSLGQLMIARDRQLHEQASLDGQLTDAANILNRALEGAIQQLLLGHDDAVDILYESTNDKRLESLQEKLGTLASQGLYLVDHNGDIKSVSLPPGLNRAERTKSRPNLSSRPYFQSARTFREPFVSDSSKSLFNRLSTIFICCPVSRKPYGFDGLLFATTQIGTWEEPLKLAQEMWRKRIAFTLVDAEGVALLPPNEEFPVIEAENPGEDCKANRGYEFDRLLALSRRDSLVSHVTENIVPLERDDDLFELPPRIRYYSVVTSFRHSRWKLALSAPLIAEK